MLQFIMGRASSGKTCKAVTDAAECAKRGEIPVILVPEQFSFECEKRVLSVLGERYAQKVSVLSFSRIYDEVNRVTGGVCTVPMSDSDRLILMKKSIKNVSNELSMFGRYSYSDGFAKKMCETVAELKLNSVNSDDLLLAAEKTDDNHLKSKISDISKILSEYNAVITERFIDPSDKLTVLYEKLADYHFFEGKTVFIDSFDGFTGQQYRIIDRIISQSKDVFITLNTDASDIREYSAFSNIKKMKERIKSIAGSHFVTVAEDIKLNERFYDEESLLRLEKYMYDTTVQEGALNAVTVCRAETVYDEAEFVARNIRKTVREKGVRYKDILVCARDTSAYLTALKGAMKKNKIPCFFDERASLSGTPIAATAICAADLLRGIRTEKILKLYKSGLDVFGTEELSTLENYVYIWNIEGKMWLENWDMNPKGFVTDKADEKKLSALNELRLRAVNPIEEMRKNCGKTAKEYVGAIMKFLEKTDAVKSCSAIYKAYKESGDMLYAEVIRRSYDSIMSVFNGIVSSFGEDILKPSEFYDALNSAISLESIGVTPQSLDEVTFGSADRIRPSRPEYVFVMGANQGVFPGNVTLNGVFTASDRTALIECGIDIPDKTVYDSVNEDYLVYTNVCSATKGLYISYSSVLADGSKGECSPFVSELCSSFDIIPVNEPQKLSKSNLPETPEGAYSDYCKYYDEDIFSRNTLFEALKSTDKKPESISGFTERPIFGISPENAKKLFGDKIFMSPSKFDTFSRCRFMYFCKYALKVQKLQKSEFNVLQRGTIIHYVLQRIIETYGKKLSELEAEKIGELVDAYIGEYLDSVSGFRSVESPKFKYIVYTISRSIKEIVIHISDEFKNSDFEPTACELVIGDDGDIPAVEIPVENSGELILTGMVDRVDKYNGYVRIIDYKSGKRDFKLSDTLFGQNMQMLIYLYAVCNNEEFGGDAAAILYMPSKRNKNGVYKMNGLITDDADIYTAMDRSESGRFVPKMDGHNKDSFISSDDFKKIFTYIEKRLKSAGKAIYGGKMHVNPIDGLDGKACEYCDFKSICRTEEKDILKVKKRPKDEILTEIERWDENADDTD